MANPEHLQILKQGVEQWNKWREDHPELRPDLGEVDLSGADLREANLSLARLREADLCGADLRGADLRRADLGAAKLREANVMRANLSSALLIGASLSGANLSEADLGAANLSHSRLNRADLRGSDLAVANLYRTHLRLAILVRAKLSISNFSQAELEEADFTGASAGGTLFAGVDLSAAKGLETIEHLGPSTIGIDTIYKSRGKIPEVFLRGCGVPDGFIAYIGSMVGRPIEFYSCFISYSTKDQEFADRLYADLQAKGRALLVRAARHSGGARRSTNKSTRPFGDTTGCC